MRKIFRKLFGNDRGDSIVSAIIVFPLLFVILITGIDYGVYMAQRGSVQNIAKDAARTIAIFGGDGSSTQQTKLEKAYGQTKTKACSTANTAQTGASKIINTASYTATECNVITQFQNARLVNSTLTSVNCGPTQTTTIGQRTYCELKWTYTGIPGSFVSFIRSKDSTITTIGSAESEVANPGLTSR